MEHNKTKGAGKQDAPGQNKEYVIIVNGRENVWSEKKISYEQVIVLAFGQVSNDPNVFYTVTFKKGDQGKPEGTLVKGDEVRVKNNMRFNVTQTNRS